MAVQTEISEAEELGVPNQSGPQLKKEKKKNT